MINDKDYEVALMIHNIKDNDDEIEYINARISELKPIINTLKEHDERIYKACMLMLYYNDVPKHYNDDLKEKFKSIRDTFLQSLPNQEIFFIKENAILSKDFYKENTTVNKSSLSNGSFDFLGIDIYDIKIIKNKEDDFYSSIESLQSLGIENDVSKDYKSVIEDIEDRLDFYYTKLNKCVRLLNSQNKIKEYLIDLEHDDSLMVLNGKEKIILMIELGIIDFLNKNKNFIVKDNMAHILSKLTGETHNSISKPLRAYLGNYNDNPMVKKTKSNTRVDEYLVSRGYKK